MATAKRPDARQFQTTRSLKVVLKRKILGALGWGDLF